MAETTEVDRQRKGALVTQKEALRTLNDPICWALLCALEKLIENYWRLAYANYEATPTDPRFS